MTEVKQRGFSDVQVTNMLDMPKKGGEDAVRAHRKGMGIEPVVKQIDTLAAEFPAETNYLYTSYHGTENDVEAGEGGVVVLGSGAYR